MQQSQQQYISAPLLYRLLDDNPHSERDMQYGNSLSLTDLQTDISNNIQYILNSRCDSLLDYGIDDFTQPKYALTHYQHLLCKIIQVAIEHFEPRLQKVNVSLLNADNERNLHLQISANLNLKPDYQAAIFETKLDIVNHVFDIEEVHYD